MCFMQINPEHYQSRPPLPEDVPLVHTDSSVILTDFALLFCLIKLLIFQLMKVDFGAQVHWLVRRRQMSRTRRRVSRTLIREGLGSGRLPPLVVATGECELSFFRGLQFVSDDLSSC